MSGVSVWFQQFCIVCIVWQFEMKMSHESFISVICYPCILPFMLLPLINFFVAHLRSLHIPLSNFIIKQ
jgi:hypothetical protein